MHFLLLQVPYKSSDIISNIYYTLLVISFHCLTISFSLFNFGLHYLGLSGACFILLFHLSFPLEIIVRSFQNLFPNGNAMHIVSQLQC